LPAPQLEPLDDRLSNGQHGEGARQQGQQGQQQQQQQQQQELQQESRALIVSRRPWRLLRSAWPLPAFPQRRPRRGGAKSPSCTRHKPFQAGSHSRHCPPPPPAGPPLQEQLMKTSGQAQQVERSMREISTLNQMLSTAVMQQVESIEALYSNALEATQHIVRGNVSIKKTVEVNRSTRKYVFVLLLVASLLLLFFDWFNS
jgi:hypothetical protein